MKNKRIGFAILLAGLQSIALDARADWFATVAEGLTLTLSEGETGLVVYAGGNSTPCTIIYTPEGGPVTQIAVSGSGDGGAATTTVGRVSSSNPLPLVGPATIAVADMAGSNSPVLGIRVVSTVQSSTTVATAGGVPSTAVVVPSDAAGSVQVVMESSTDLITWTGASPGSYGSSTSKRFFRLRAINTP